MNSGKWIILAIALIVLGAVLFCAVMTTLGWDFLGLSTANYETNTHEIENTFTDVSIDTDTADVVFIKSEDATARVVCYERPNMKHSVSVENGTLTIKVNDERRWYEHISFGFSSPKITVYLPEAAYNALKVKTDTGRVDIPADFAFGSIDVTVSTGNVKNLASADGRIKISASTGDIYLKNISARELDLTTSTGDIYASGINCGSISITVSTGETELEDVLADSLTSIGSTGDIELNSTVVRGLMSITRSTGDIELNGCDAAEITIETDTGDVEGTLLSGKSFDVHTDTGKVRVPETSGGKCKITTDTGDVEIRIEN